MKGAQYLVRALEREGVEYLFGYPGGAIMPVYDALVEAKFKHVLVRHEQGAALAASGYARATGKVGVCMATSGPGATNLVTGIADAFLDSVPVVAITGQVATPFIGTDAFQEVDVLGITMPIVKHGFLPRNASDLGWMIREAFHIARSGRPGPVIIDLPKDVSLMDVPDAVLPPKPEERPAVPAEEEIEKAVRLYSSSKRPVIYVGGGVQMGRCIEIFRKFVRETRLPVVSTLKGLGTIPGDYELFLGMLGMHGTQAANHAVQGSDLLIVVGARFDDRATGKLAEFAPKARVLHLDIDPCEIGKLREANVGLTGWLEPGLKALTFALPDSSIGEWRRECLESRAKYSTEYDPQEGGIYAPRLLRNLSRRAGPKTIVTSDVGQHQMWVAQHYSFRHPEQHLTSGGLGTMGHGLPAAIGAQFGRTDHTVIAVTGDGSIMMNIQELATINRYKLPVKILLFDNGCLGLVRQWQELFFEKRFSQVSLHDNPDFAKVAEAFGIPALTIESREQEDEAIEALLNVEGPLFVHAKISPQENVWPLVPPGFSNSHMLEGSKQ